MVQNRSAMEKKLWVVIRFLTENQQVIHYRDKLHENVGISDVFYVFIYIRVN